MDKKAVYSTGRLVLGIIAIILFALIALQSCVAGLGNALEESDSISGSSGFVLSVFMLAGGITSVATRKSTGKGGLIACAILFGIAAVMGATSWNSDYSDLKIWGFVSVIYCAFYVVCIRKTGKLSSASEKKQIEE